jgi:gliding motility-associated-like protein
VFVDFANAQFVDPNTNYNFSWAPTGVMDSTAIDYARKDDIVDDTVIYYNIEHPLYPQCSFTDTIDLNVGGVQIDSFNVVNPQCYNEAVPSGQVNFFWSQNISSPITTLFKNGQFFASNFGATSFAGLPADTYQIAIRDARCFDTLDFVITAADTLFIDTSNLVLDICQTSPTDQIAGVINGIAPYTYYWDGIDTDTLSLQSNTDTTITIYAIDDVGCSSDSVDVTFVLPDPLSIEQFDTTVCTGVQLPIPAIVSGGTGNYRYAWNTGDSTAAVIVTATQGEIYSVTVSDGCMLPASMTANIDYLVAPDVDIIRSFPDSNNLPNLTTSYDENEVIRIYSGDKIVFQPSEKPGTYSYFWDMWHNGTQDDANEGWPLISNPGDVDAESPYRIEGDYQVMLITTTEDGCVDTSYAWHTVLLQPDPPNVFTPNGDGVNDRFFIPGGEGIRDFKLVIYNRWGRQVFETNDGSEAGGWDGAGHKDGVYYYIATGDRRGESYQEQGTITLTGSGN